MIGGLTRRDERGKGCQGVEGGEGRGCMTALGLGWAGLRRGVGGGGVGRGFRHFSREV